MAQVVLRKPDCQSAAKSNRPSTRITFENVLTNSQANKLPLARGRSRWGNCVKKDRKVCAVRMMKVGPSEPLCKKRLQTAVSGLCRKTMVVNVTVKRRGLITSGVNERGECE